jgi:hypothetical protein
VSTAKDHGGSQEDVTSIVQVCYLERDEFGLNRIRIPESGLL